MAEMLPTSPSAATASHAELRLFRRFREEAPADWIVLHSLGLRRHHRKPWAEADFVVITNVGVTVVEVKGGLVRRNGRQWFTNDKALRESPFDQVGGATAALNDDLRSNVAGIAEGLVMSAVAFPDGVFDRDGPDLIPEIVYDQRDTSAPLETWFDRVAAYWRQRIDGSSGRQRRGLSRSTRRAIVDWIAGDFELRPSLRARLGEVESELVRFTEQQAAVMRALSTNPRILVTGGAGTGKTWLALEDALRASQEGGRVLLMCHTKALAGWLRERLAGRQGIEVVHFNGLTTRLIRDNGLWDRLSDADRDHVFRVEHPELALEALCAQDDPKTYDVVIVDEAQDILTVPAVDLLDGLLLGGLMDGQWRLFLDPAQDVFHGLDVAAMSKLEAYRPTRFPLTVNCRNTAEIATQTAIMAERSLEESLPIGGPDVEYFEYQGEPDHRRRACAILRSWLDGGVPPSQIVVLGHRSIGFSVFPDGQVPGVGPDLVETTKVPEGRQAIRYATISSFKGLEADAVLLLDIGPLPSAKRAVDIYVAMSRAKTLLAVGVDSRYADGRNSLYSAFGARIGTIKRSG